MPIEFGMEENPVGEHQSNGTIEMVVVFRRKLDPLIFAPMLR